MKIFLLEKTVPNLTRAKAGASQLEPKWRTLSFTLQNQANVGLFGRPVFGAEICCIVVGRRTGFQTLAESFIINPEL